MNIIVGYPPNWEQLKKTFPDADSSNVVITYGDTIYNPSNAVLQDHLVEHEEVHSRQQKNHPGGIDGYMKRYSEDANFRLEVEIEAYLAQLRFIRKKYGPAPAIAALALFATHLSSPLYKGMITYHGAMERLSSYVLA